MEKILLSVFREMDPVSLKWFVRIVLKDMKLGLGQTSVMNQFHPDAKDLYDVNANLRKVCEQLKDPNVRLNEIEVELFQVCNMTFNFLNLIRMIFLSGVQADVGRQRTDQGCREADGSQTV